MPILKLENISKSFGAINALNEVSLSINPGEVLGLMGDNGAGKSTLIKIIAGNFKPTSGNIIFNEEKVEFAKPMDARNKGIEVVYQDLALCDNLSAASNIFLTREIKKNFSIFSIIDFKKMYEKSREIFKELKSETLPEEEVKMMSGGQRQAVAIGRTKLSRAKVVLLDEPTAAISVRQVAEVLDLIKQLKNEGIAVVIISHRMPDVFAVSDKIAVLRRGQMVANKLANESSPEEVTALITGAIDKA
ncbi:MAG: sugar ABC transporter ATP-binding protein [Flavobacteriales bacterium]|jgi:simple sugar transport system ATP-binding protein|nr:sugar ABC transporter ATP-binding protein [Flavobacteriales bacterium]|tara:strand:+ start:277 stop:1017 length:741 start_codon:yes stop_codon:yes gene_type:complete